MSVVEEFGEMRGLLERRPSTAVFDVMTQRLEAAASLDEAQVRSEWLPYVESKLSRWPDEARLCPKHRLEDYESGKPIWCGLVRALDYESVSLKKSRLTQVIEAPNAHQITHLDIRSANLKWDQIERLAREALFKLKSFGFRRVSAMQWHVLDQLFASEMLSDVERLNFRGWDKIMANVYTCLMTHFRLENLRALDVSGGAMSARKLKDLLQTGRTDRLEEFRAAAWVADKSTRGMIDEFVKREEVKGLRVLDVRGCKARELKNLASAEHLSSLRALHLGWDAELDHIGEVLESPHFTSLEELTLHVEPEQWSELFEVLAHSPVLNGLTSLKLHGELKNDPRRQHAFERFLESGRLESLQRFGLPFDEFMMDAMSERADVLPELQQLMITGSLGELHEPAKRLFATRYWPALDALTINMNNAWELFDALKHGEAVKYLRHLKLGLWKREGLSSFLREGEFVRLETLDLSGVGYQRNDKLYASIMETPHLEALETIFVENKYKVHVLEKVLEESDHNLSSFLHLGYPEYAMLQTDEWV